MGQVKLRSYEMIEEENKEMKMMMRKLCHEMGNALTLLGGSLFYLEHELKVNDTKVGIKNVKEDYAYICSLFGNLREYNHTEAIEKKDITMADIAECIKSVFEKLNTSSDTALKIEYPLECQEETIYADITKLQQALVNVMKNGIEAMEENDEKKGKNMTVRIATETVPYQGSGESSEDKNSDIMAREIMNIMHIEIRDNGKGISEKNINDIFCPMYTYGKKQGTGLGLSVAKKIIEDHRGKIKAVSAVGTGTAIHIYLPLSKTCVQSNI